MIFLEIRNKIKKLTWVSPYKTVKTERKSTEEFLSRNETHNIGRPVAKACVWIWNSFQGAQNSIEINQYSSADLKDPYSINMETGCNNKEFMSLPRAVNSNLTVGNQLKKKHFLSDSIWKSAERNISNLNSRIMNKNEYSNYKSTIIVPKKSNKLILKRNLLQNFKYKKIEIINQQKNSNKKAKSNSLIQISSNFDIKNPNPS